VHRFELSFGHATVFYPEASAERCTVCLLLEIDPVAMVRRKSGPAGDGGVFTQYVNDRPYVASSFLSVAISEVFGTAMTGRSKDRPELAATAIPLEATLPSLPSRGGEEMIRKLFEPLGYSVQLERLPLDARFPDWGPSRYYAVKLTGTQRLQDLLTHLNVLVPVLDEDKHYYVGDDEVEKLLRRGGDWLPTHPEKEAIAYRHFKLRKSLDREAIERLTKDVAEGEDAEAVEARERREETLEARVSLNEKRLAAVAAAVKSSGAKSVVDLGCGSGKLLRELVQQRQLARIVGMDVSLRSIERAATSLRLEQLAPAARARIELLHGSLLYRDRRLEGFDVATLVEVIEHLDAARLRSMERVVFECAHPKTVLVTTPNVEYNVKFETLPNGTRVRLVKHFPNSHGGARITSGVAPGFGDAGGHFAHARPAYYHDNA
jgi:3' terminal RNA ribose 2'-O-methyltransferase Hen1